MLSRRPVSEAVFGKYTAVVVGLMVGLAKAPSNVSVVKRYRQIHMVGKHKHGKSPV